MVNETLAALKLAQHPDKTFIGRTSRGFDFLGYQFTPSGLAVAAKTIERFAERLTRLYERGAAESRIGDYVRRWQRWVTGGLGARKLDGVTRLENYRSGRLAGNRTHFGADLIAACCVFICFL